MINHDFMIGPHIDAYGGCVCESDCCYNFKDGCYCIDCYCRQQGRHSLNGRHRTPTPAQEEATA